MRRLRVVFAVVFSILALGIGFEAARFLINGIQATFGIGIPRLVMPGLMNLALAAVFIALARRIYLLARQNFVLVRHLDRASAAGLHDRDRTA